MKFFFIDCVENVTVSVVTLIFHKLLLLYYIGRFKELTKEAIISNKQLTTWIRAFPV